MNIKAVFGERLRELRGDMSQAEFGEKIGVSRGSVSYYENGTRTADIEILYKINSTFNVSVDWLLGMSDVKVQDIEVHAISRTTGLSEVSVKEFAELSNGKSMKNKIFMIIFNYFVESGFIKCLLNLAYMYMRPVDLSMGYEDNSRCIQEKEFCSWKFSTEATKYFNIVCEKKAMHLSELFKKEFSLWKKHASPEDVGFAKVAQAFDVALRTQQDFMREFMGSEPIIDFDAITDVETDEKGSDDYGEHSQG